MSGAWPLSLLNLQAMRPCASRHLSKRRGCRLYLNARLEDVQNRIRTVFGVVPQVRAGVCDLWKLPLDEQARAFLAGRRVDMFDE